MSEVVQFKSKPKDVDFGELIQLYLDTRDAKIALERKQKQHLKQYTEVMTMIEGRLLAHLQEHGGTSFACDAGTAYISRRRSAPIHDTVAFKEYVIANRDWEMLDWKANVTAVGEYMAEHQSLPPGVNFKTDVTLNVQRK